MQENFDQKYEWILDIEDERSISTGIVVRCGSDMNSTTPNFFLIAHIFVAISNLCIILLVETFAHISMPF
jgi:hypothetical protein